ncbi:MAG: methyltransferase domain-containing protein [Caldimonas sp.]
MTTKVFIAPCSNAMVTMSPLATCVPGVLRRSASFCSTFLAYLPQMLNVEIRAGLLLRAQLKLVQIEPLLRKSVDLAVMVDVYHELAFPYEVLGSIVRALKPGGQLVFVEYRAEDPQVPIKTLHKMSEAQIKREAAAHGVVWDHTVGTLPWQHLVVFRKRN